MKCRLHQPPLPQMKLAFAREQTFAQQHPRALQRPALGEVRLIGDQNFAHQIGMVHQINVLRPQPEVRQIAVLARHLHQKINRMSAECWQMAHHGQILRASRLGLGQQHSATSLALV